MLHTRTTATVPAGTYSVVAQQEFAANPGGVQLNAMIFVPASLQNEGTLTCALSFDATNPKSLLETRTFTLAKSGNEFIMSTNRGYSIAGKFIAYVQCFTLHHATATPLTVQVDMDLTVVTDAAPFNTGTN